MEASYAQKKNIALIIQELASLENVGIDGIASDPTID